MVPFQEEFQKIFQNVFHFLNKIADDMSHLLDIQHLTDLETSS